MTSRGKSWVSRRLGLAEALSEELQAQIGGVTGPGEP